MTEPLTDEQVRQIWRQIWRWARETPTYTWRDEARYRLTCRPRWAVRLW